MLLPWIRRAMSNVSRNKLLYTVSFLILFFLLQGDVYVFGVALLHSQLGDELWTRGKNDQNLDAAGLLGKIPDPELRWCHTFTNISRCILNFSGKEHLRRPQEIEEGYRSRAQSKLVYAGTNGVFANLAPS